jgi:hypothetical protein
VLPSSPKLLIPTLAAVLAGSLLMLLFDATLTRIAGVVGILGFIVLGVFMIATPEYLAGEQDERDAS